MVVKELFHGMDRYTVSSGDLSVSVIPFGATVTDIHFRGMSCALPLDDAELCRNNASFVGVAVGRYANRIGGAEIELDGKKYLLSANEGKNQLHGGPEGWNTKTWIPSVEDENALRFTIQAPDGENGFPGNMTASVCYRVSGSALRIEFEGVTDGPTVFAPTTHIYFSLNGKGAMETSMQINASHWLAVDSELIPSGMLEPCTDDFDFSVMRPVMRDYDHCFVLNGKEACVASAGGVTLRMETDFPGLQFYTGKYLGDPFRSNQGFAVEPEFFPDSPHHAQWPSVVLRPGETFRRYVEYSFS